MSDETINYGTGNAPPNFAHAQRNVTKKGKVELWYIDPLLKMRGDDAFICLMVCFPLIETIIRKELKLPEDEDISFSEGSSALKWFAKFMTIPEQHARRIWDAFRNGLLHRAMIKGSLDYALTGASANRPAKVDGSQIRIYVWDLRDQIVGKLKLHHRELWAGDQNTW